MIAVARVPAGGDGIVSLEHSLPELRRLGVHRRQPEPLRGSDVSILMDVDPEDEPAAVDPGGVKEAQEKVDQGRIAVNEGDAVAAAVRLVLRALAPVGDSPGRSGSPAR